MATHWFRITFARAAFLRTLSIPLESLAVADGVRAMVAFQADHRPQHAHLDTLECAWGPRGERFEFALTRRIHREGQPESTLSLAFEYALTPPRELSGSVLVTSVRDVTATAGYRAIARASVLARRLD